MTDETILDEFDKEPSRDYAGKSGKYIRQGHRLMAAGRETLAKRPAWRMELRSQKGAPARRKPR